MTGRHGLCIALALVAGCAPAAGPGEPAPGLPPLSECGLRAAIAGSPSRPESGDPVRACVLPSAEDIANACRSREAVPIAGSENPDRPGEPLYRFPDYSVSRASCVLADPGGTRAACEFDLAGAGAPPARVRALLVHRFRDLSNDVMHGWYWAGWEADSPCRPG
ncbi:MAG TPA: hypothetical protein VF759_13000 [Allosphingosinicella sp.]|jgi:hypothetical protein